MITPEQLSSSDPCGLLIAGALSRFGRVSIEVGAQFADCEATVSLADGGIVMVSSGFTLQPHEGAPVTPVVRNGVTVYGDAGDSNGCRRYIAVSDHATIAVTASLNQRRDVTCKVADAAIDGMLPQLVQGKLRPAELPANSLGKQDACRLLDHTEVRRIAGIDPRQVHPAYNGQGCEWNTGTVPGPLVSVTFWRTSRPKVDEGTDRAITIDGRQAIVDTWVGGGSGATRKLPSCDVHIAHRPLDRPTLTREVERLTVTVYTEAPEEANCAPAIELATAALGRLPQS